MLKVMVVKIRNKGYGVTGLGLGLRFRVRVLKGEGYSDRIQDWGWNGLGSSC